MVLSAAAGVALVHMDLPAGVRRQPRDMRICLSEEVDGPSPRVVGQRSRREDAQGGLGRQDLVQTQSLADGVEVFIHGVGGLMEGHLGKEPRIDRVQDQAPGHAQQIQAHAPRPQHGPP